MGPVALRASAKPAGRFVAVIDIGSNSVRLVVYDGLTRAPTPVFNERVLCGLGRGIAITGQLDPEGVAMAQRAFERFVTIAEALEADLVDVVATAAIRDASNGRAFVASLEASCKVGIRILAGDEEARVSALGVISGSPEADGLMGDLGGGSLEVVALDGGKPGRGATLPLGPLRLRKGSAGEVRAAVEEAFKAVPWLAGVEGRDFYAVGGSWRALARVHIAQTQYPIHIVHNYVMSRTVADDVTRLLAKMSPDSTDRISGIAKRRAEILPVAALVLRMLLKAAKPRRVVFSAYGLREGLLFDRLSEAERREDPLIAGCRAMVARDKRGIGDEDTCWEWARALFPGESEYFARLRRAACVLRDIAWRAHPDYRAEQAFALVLRAPLVGLDHPGRVFLAMALYARYDGGLGDAMLAPLQRLIDPDTVKRAELVGLVLRLAHSLSGNAVTLAQAARLEAGVGKVQLRLTDQGRRLIGEAVERRLAAVAKALDRQAEIVTA